MIFRVMIVDGQVRTIFVCCAHVQFKERKIDEFTFSVIQLKQMVGI